LSNLAQLVALHMGALHRYEWALLGLVAFGPFVVLFIVVYVVRRRDLSEEARTGGGPEG
jgi:hypothetical protein